MPDTVESLEANDVGGTHRAGSTTVPVIVRLPPLTDELLVMSRSTNPTRWVVTVDEVIVQVRVSL